MRTRFVWVKVILELKHSIEGNEGDFTVFRFEP